MTTSFKREYQKGHNRNADRLARLAITEYFQGPKSIDRANYTDDRLGVDYWVNFEGGRVGVDVKTAYTSPSALSLETWSVVEAQVIGWTLRKDYRTDFVIWVWPHSEQYFVLPFRPLRRTFELNASSWACKYGARQNCTQSLYHSEYINVPRNVIVNALKETGRRLQT